jgi:hypothetical protein
VHRLFDHPVFYLFLKLRGCDLEQSIYGRIEVKKINCEQLHLQALLDYESASQSLCQQIFQAFREEFDNTKGI